MKLDENSTVGIAKQLNPWFYGALFVLLFSLAYAAMFYLGAGSGFWTQFDHYGVAETQICEMIYWDSAIRQPFPDSCAISLVSLQAHRTQCLAFSANGAAAFCHCLCLFQTGQDMV